MTTKKISVFRILGKNVLTRNNMRDFFVDVESKKEDNILLDFSNVEFISRSCADEYLKLKAKSNKILDEINMKKNISLMLKAVNKTVKHISKFSEKSSIGVICYN